MTRHSSILDITGDEHFIIFLVQGWFFAFKIVINTILIISITKLIFFITLLICIFGNLNRDDPNDMPVFVASNSAKENCTIMPRGENIFAAVL